MNFGVHKNSVFLPDFLCVARLERMCLDVRVLTNAKNPAPLIIDDCGDIHFSAHREIIHLGH